MSRVQYSENTYPNNNWDLLQAVMKYSMMSIFSTAIYFATVQNSDEIWERPKKATHGQSVWSRNADHQSREEGYNTAHQDICPEITFLFGYMDFLSGQISFPDFSPPGYPPSRCPGELRVVYFFWWTGKISV